jgi:hypothetical protein
MVGARQRKEKNNLIPNFLVSKKAIRMCKMNAFMLFTHNRPIGTKRGLQEATKIATKSRHAATEGSATKKGGFWGCFFCLLSRARWTAPLFLSKVVSVAVPSSVLRYMATVSLIPSTSEVAGDFHTSSAASFLLGEMSRNPQDNVLAEAVALLQYVRHTHHLPNFAAAIRQLGIEAGYKKVQPQQHHTGHPHAPFSRTDAIAAHQKIIRGQHASIVQLKHQVAVLGFVEHFFFLVVVRTFPSYKTIYCQKGLLSMLRKNDERMGVLEGFPLFLMPPIMEADATFSPQELCPGSCFCCYSTQ